MYRLIFLFVKIALILSTIVGVLNQANSQCNGMTVPPPGDICSEAPILCQLECLNFFSGTLPDTFIAPQPASLCNGGQSNNMSWFGFVAGSDSVNITITPSSCTVVVDTMGNNISGVQVGVYNTCDFEDPDREVVCQVDCGSTAQPIDIESGDFIPGQTYYLFVDGCAGSICDYSVSINFGEQAFEMPEFTTVSNEYNLDFSSDSLCAGSTIDIMLDSFDLDVEYHWLISPSTPDYPTGRHPITDTSAVNWVFSEAGNYDICVFASNFCDANDTMCFQVMVDTLVDEYFSDINVCQECFPIILASSDTTCVMGEGIVPTILTEDPNNDGIPGWLDFTPVMTPGTVVREVPGLYGCTYRQIVNVNSIPIGPREPVTIYKCIVDYPFEYEGQTITGPVTNQFITIPNGAQSGCDSLISLTVETFGISSSIAVGDCEDGGVYLHFDLGAPIPEGATLSYTWRSGFNEVNDTDGVDTTLFVTTSGTYSVEVELTINGSSCTVSRPSPPVDLDNLNPDIPTFGMFPDEYCVTDEVVLYVEQSSSDLEYDWSLVPPLPFVFGSTSDTIYVNTTGNLGFQYSAVAVNECGMSDETNGIITIVEPPTVDIDLQQESCVDSVVTITYIGNADAIGATFDWTFDQGTIVSTTNINGPGPHQVVWSNVGEFDVSVVVTQGVCETELHTESIVIIPSTELQPVLCATITGGVSFDIGESPFANFTYTVVSGTYDEVELVGNLLIFSGMEPDNTVVIEVTWAGDCGTVSDTYSCTSADCEERQVDIILLASSNEQCEDVDIPVGLEAFVDGAASTDGTWTINGDVVTDAFITPSDFNVGNVNISYTEEIDGCVYSADTVLTILPVPELSYTVSIDSCAPASGATIAISSNLQGAILRLDDVLTPDGVVDGLSSGNYLASVMLDGCSTQEQITIDLPQSTELYLEGDTLVLEGTLSAYTYDTNVFADSVVWTLNGDMICIDCDEVMITPVRGDYLCVTVFTGSDLCEQQACMEISVIREVKVEFPTVFSPNGDGNNDTFYPITNEPNLLASKMRIYDRWGNCVFHIENQSMGEQSTFWDGTFNGKHVENGVYVYFFEYVDHNGEIQQILRDITVLK